MKLTDPEVIKHLKENYYIRRETWDKYTGIYHDTRSFCFVCGPCIYEGYSISLIDLIANDWILCPKE